MVRFLIVAECEDHQRYRFAYHDIRSNACKYMDYMRTHNICLYTNMLLLVRLRGFVVLVWPAYPPVVAAAF